MCKKEVGEMERENYKPAKVNRAGWLVSGLVRAKEGIERKGQLGYQYKERSRG